MPIILAGATSGSATVQATDAQTVTLTLPATSGTLALTTGGGSPSFATLTVTGDASISGLTVGKGGGSQTYNTAIGVSALPANTTGNYNVALGNQAMVNSTTASNNIAIGYGTLANTSGNNNTGIGYLALTANGGGAANTALGYQALQANSSASNNTAVGYQAGYSNTTSNSSVYIGYQAGYAATGTFNTIIGVTAGYNVTGTKNTFVGGTNGVTGAAGQAITSGSANTIIGSYTGNQGGLDIRTASNYIVLSDGDGNPRGVFDNNGTFSVGTTDFSGANTGGFEFYVNNYARIYFGHPTGTISGSYYAAFQYNTNLIGSITQTGTTAVLYNTTSDYRLKNDVAPLENALATIESLNPVSFTWVDGRKDDGFLAHEIQAVIPNCVTGEKDAINEDGTPKYQQMDNSGVIPFLVKAIQELNAKVEAQAAQIAALTGAK
jgi:hypothetical protein